MNRILPLGALLLAVACRGTLSPLSNRIEVGQEPYVIMVADGEDGLGDLFASSTAGGMPWQITFTRVDERLPSLSPDGISLAFIRSRAPGDTAVRHVAVMNLLNGSERQLPLPAAVRVEQLAWSVDGRQLYVRSANQLLVSPAPPAPAAFTEVPPATSIAVESLFVVAVGAPPAGTVENCAGGSGLCVRLMSGRVVPLAPEGSAPLRWSGDSVAYWNEGGYVVRPLGGGRARPLAWKPPLSNPRQATMFPGSGRRDGPG